MTWKKVASNAGSLGLESDICTCYGRSDRTKFVRFFLFLSYHFYYSVSASHHVFVHLDTSKIYCLPDSYEVYLLSLFASSRIRYEKKK